MVKLIDLSHIIESIMPVYPGDIETKLVQNKFIQQDYYNNHRLEVSMHAGTHIDSPMHMLDVSTYISELPLESFVGPGCIIDVRGQTTISLKPEYEQMIPPHSIVLLYSGHASLYGTDSYYDHPSIEMDLCELLVKKNIKVLGVDWASPDKYPFPVHYRLLGQNIYILENLTNLDQLLEVESFEVMALPLKLRADSSLVRAVARVL